MRSVDFGRYALMSCVAAAMLAGCGGSQSPIGATGPSAVSVSPMALHSRMKDYARSDLVYVSDNIANQVYVLSYPNGDLVQTLGGFDSPMGECSDLRGNVWITNYLSNQLNEYSHGGASPIATLKVRRPTSCSVDPTSGNLAVTTGYPGTISIYVNGGGTPTKYTDPDLAVFDYCTYDDQGDLFVDGSSSTIIAELAEGNLTFTSVMLSREMSPGSMQWDGKYLAIVDTAGGSVGPTPVRLVSVSGTTGTVVQTIFLKSRGNRKATLGVQYWIQGRRILGPNHSREDQTKLFEFWRYPKGGRTQSVVRPPGARVLWGTTVSVGPNR